jgi:3-hydroxyacyl-[acyl-carrier-protein] dehydratase
LKAATGVGAWNTVEHVFAADHPTAAGHFPGNPIIPGALLLDHVVRVAGRGRTAREVRSVKFLRPVRPGDRVVIRWRATENSDVAFECRLADADQPALVGSLIWNVE